MEFQQKKSTKKAEIENFSFVKPIFISVSNWNAVPEQYN